MSVYKLMRLIGCFFLLLFIAGCSFFGGTNKKGGYYQDDGPDARPPSNLDQIPDAIPRIEPLAKKANEPYTAFGKRYVPNLTGQPYKKRGLASWYGKKYHGNLTSMGERYDMYAMTAAHTTLPLPSYVRITSEVNGRSIIVRVNDRGPFHSDRIIDLSYVAAYKLGLIAPGSGVVVVESISPQEIKNLSTQPIAQIHSKVPLTVLPITSPSNMSETRVSAENVYLQLGAFNQVDNAQTVVVRAKDTLDLQGTLQVILEKNQDLYKVKLGPYPDREAALRAVQGIFDKIGIMPSIAHP